MPNRIVMVVSLLRLCLVLLLLVAFLGCENSSPNFHLDMVHIRKNDDPEVSFTEAQLENLANVLTAIFGTPDEPYVWSDASVGFADLMDEENLGMAAGPVGRDEWGQPRGLYRRHCAHCHGISGDGAGPTAPFLNPYPRDYRMGIYKFKSTPIGERPTDEDLKRIVRNGIPGTAMPSFDLLAHDEVEALIDYVKYLSIRGEVERSLTLEMSDADAEALIFDSEADDAEDAIAVIQENVSFVVNRWKRADSKVAVPVSRPENLDVRTASAEEMQASVKRGHALFHGVVANCFSCHGNTALGDGQLNLYDKWTEELDPKNPEESAQLAGLMERPMPIRNIRPRNLRLGVYRGGRRPIDLYWRIHNGIEGSNMPQVPLREPDDPPEKKGITRVDLWDLINYVRSLPYEELSRPPYQTHDKGIQLVRPR